jgi:hypothetical protein
MNDFADMRSALGEISATLIGFSVIFEAFTGRQTADGHSRERVMLIVEIGLMVVALCFLPELLVGLGLSQSISFRVLSSIVALYWLRWLILNYRIRGADHLTPILFRVATALHLIVVGCSIANAAVVGSDALYTTACFAGLAVVGCGFLAQFRIERL